VHVDDFYLLRSLELLIGLDHKNNDVCGHTFVSISKSRVLEEKERN